MDASVSKHSLATRKSLKCDDGWLQAEVVARHSNRRRRDVLEMDESICITRRSHRRQMIFMFQLPAGSRSVILSGSMAKQDKLRRVGEPWIGIKLHTENTDQPNASELPLIPKSLKPWLPFFQTNGVVTSLTWPGLFQASE